MAALSEHLTRGCLSAENPYIADSLMDSVAMRNPLYSVSRERYGGAAEGSASAEGVGVDVSDPGIEPEPSGRAVVGSFTLWRGRKVYELKNHLGNVLAVVSGVKLGVSTATYSPAPVDYYTADVVEMSDYEPAPDPRIGWMLLAKRHWVSGEGYRFGFNGMGGKKLVEAASEVKGEGMSYRTYFRELDSRLARWWSFDPKSTVFESPFAAMGGNPILFTDVLGDSVRGVNAISAERTLGAIRGTFRGDRAVELQSLFRLKADGKTFEGISEGDFVNAVAGLSTEQQQLAYSYFQAINGSNMHSIEVVTPEEIVSCATDQILNPKNNSTYCTGADVDRNCGGGVNVGTSGTSTLSLLVMNSTATVPFAKGPVQDLRTRTLAELFAHEVIGHGQGRVLGSPTYAHQDAIQMTNLFLHSQGYSKNIYRNGNSHGDGSILGIETANSVPKFAEIPANIQMNLTLAKSNQYLRVWTRGLDR